MKPKSQESIEVSQSQYSFVRNQQKCIGSIIGDSLLYCLVHNRVCFSIVNNKVNCVVGVTSLLPYEVRKKSENAKCFHSFLPLFHMFFPFSLAVPEIIRNFADDKLTEHAWHSKW